MKEKDERNLTVIDGVKVEDKIDTEKKASRQTNPIVKKLLEFHNESAGKFSVIDLFKK